MLDMNTPARVAKVMALPVEERLKLPWQEKMLFLADLLDDEASHIAEYNIHVGVDCDSDCGTAACIAGTAFLAFTESDPRYENREHQFDREFSGQGWLKYGGDYDTPYSKIGVNLLGIDFHSAEQLFFPFNRADWNTAWSRDHRKAAAVLRHFVATGEVDWSAPVTDTPMG